MATINGVSAGCLPCPLSHVVQVYRTCSVDDLLVPANRTSSVDALLVPTHRTSSMDALPLCNNALQGFSSCMAELAAGCIWRHVLNKWRVA
eukprot:10088854-Karenia_brevis.AAC.1